MTDVKNCRRFYGYRHWTNCEELSRCFNVGKGTKCRPYAKGKTARSHKWHAIAQRLGCDVEICIGPVTNEEACAWEIENIKLMKTRTYSHHHNDYSDVGCNFTDGGDGTLGRLVSQETRAKMKKKHSEESKAKMRGRVVSEETRIKLRARIVSEKTCIKLSALNKGRKKSPEHCTKLSKAASRRTMPNDVRAKMSASHKGRIATPETRAVLRAIHARRRYEKYWTARQTATASER